MAMEVIIWLGKKWLNATGSAFVKKAKSKKANQAVASFFKSSIGKIDRFLKSGLVWSLKSENEIIRIIFFCSFLIDSNLEG